MVQGVFNSQHKTYHEHIDKKKKSVFEAQKIYTEYSTHCTLYRGMGICDIFFRRSRIKGNQSISGLVKGSFRLRTKYCSAHYVQEYDRCLKHFFPLFVFSSYVIGLTSIILNAVSEWCAQNDGSIIPKTTLGNLFLFSSSLCLPLYVVIVNLSVDSMQNEKHSR